MPCKADLHITAHYQRLPGRLGSVRSCTYPEADLPTYIESSCTQPICIQQKGFSSCLITNYNNMLACSKVVGLTRGHQLDPISQTRSLVSRARGNMRQLLSMERKIDPKETPASVLGLAKLAACTSKHGRELLQ